MIIKDFDGDIPRTVQDMCKLPGVGPKMAYLCSNAAWNECVGIGVDVHVHRIANRLGWVTSKKPEDTRKTLERWMPRDLWTDVNLLLVGFGQERCGAKPKCSTCLVKELCPGAETEVTKSPRAKSSSATKKAVGRKTPATKGNMKTGDKGVTATKSKMKTGDNGVTEGGPETRGVGGDRRPRHTLQRTQQC
eukprot:TRINITY_DN860_c0_g2_i3.p2 TRINITY_DN860_c0_g2~~TRINITY_DN860_c0_g2_i3.p2  ORF type:complete len:191 (+),score=22.02 TRINITY_DN860_c0_g2_i3:764-1336(+)